MGATSDNNPVPNGGTLSRLAIVVDPRTETTYVIDRFAGTAAVPDAVVGSPPAVSCDPGSDHGQQAGAQDAAVRHETVFAVEPEATVARAMAQFAEGKQVRVIFPNSGVLFGADDATSMELQLRDPQTGAVLVRQALPGPVDFLDLSADGRYLAGVTSASAVPSSSEVDRTVTLTDATTLATVATTCFAGRPITRWLHAGNRLAVLVGDETAMERIRVWSMDEVVAAGYPTGADGLWANPQVDVTLGTTAAYVGESVAPTGPGLSMRAVNPTTVSPNDQFLAFEADVGAGTSADPQVSAIVVVDLNAGTSTVNRGIRGPAAFTPDGSLLVGWDEVPVAGDAGVTDGGDAGTRGRLALIDPAGATPTSFMPLPFDGGPQYFVTREGHDVLAAPGDGATGPLVLVDLTTGAVTSVAAEGPSGGLTNFVSRVGHDEIWLLEGGGLRRIDLRDGSTELTGPDFYVDALGILPARDRLVLSGHTESGEAAVVFWDPSARAVTATAPYGE